MPQLVVCHACAADVADDAPRCPKCGTPWPGGRPVHADAPAQAPRRRLGCLASSLIIVVVLMVFSQVGNCLNPPAPPTPEEAAREAARQAVDDSLDARDAAGFPTANALKIAAEYAIRDGAADPDAIDVRSCGVAGDVPATPPSYSDPWRIRCEFAGRNGFGGMVIQRATLDYYETGNARVVSVD